MGLRHLKRSPLFIVSVLVLGAAPHDAGAWGFGRAQTSAVLGVPLDFNVALRLEPGEAAPECLQVDVVVGDVPLPRSVVSAVLETASASPVVRVRTLLAIDEPLVTVNLSAGCSARVTRRFTLLADPPGHLAAPALASAESAAAAAAAAAPAPAAPAQPAAPTAAAAPVTPVTPAPAANVPPPGTTAGAAPGSVRSGPEPAASAAKAATPPRPRRADATQLAEAKSGPAEAPKAPAAPRPRLQLDAPMVAPKTAGAGPAAAKPAAVLAAEEAASAARAAASAAEARAAAMEKNIEALRQEAKANRESLARLTQALQEAQAGSSTPLALWGGLAGLGALSALLMVRLRRQQRGEGQAPWWSPGAAAPAPGEAEALDATAEQAPLPGLSLDGLSPAPGQTAPAPASPVTPAAQVRATGFDSVPAPAIASAPALRELPPLPDPEEMDSPVGAMERTQLLPPSASSVSAPIQGVPIEELLDLEQQVEFFTVLGQDDAAEGLLVDHLRSTGGTYPLPYLKLLEIYRRRGDEESYERIRDRFNQRFNAVAPSWGASVDRDRHLEDMPEVMRKIEQVWPRPVDAMALLENMLVRTEGGTLLEMSALGEVLFLFTLARDLHEQEEGSAGPVDVLLPLDDLFGAPEISAPAAPAAPDYPATQFAASSFASLTGASAGRTAAAAGMAGLGALAGLSQGAADAPAADELDHFDLPLGEPMFEPVFDLPTPAPQRAAPAQSAFGDGTGLPSLAASIDLPSFGEESPMAAVAPVGEPFGTGSVDEPLGLDLSYSGEQDPPSQGAQAGAGGADDPFLEPLSFDLPDLEAIQAPMPSKPEPASAMDLDISLDGLELEPVAPKLSRSEEQAASNFGLFNEKPTPGKPR